jgi:hypothetical protein
MGFDMPRGFGRSHGGGVIGLGLNLLGQIFSGFDGAGSHPAQQAREEGRRMRGHGLRAETIALANGEGGWNERSLAARKALSKVEAQERQHAANDIGNVFNRG